MQINDAVSPDAVAKLIAAADAGDNTATGELFADLYRELHRLAARQLGVRAPSATLGATTLVHECYLDMAGRAAIFPDRARFIGYAARAMRGLIIDYIRARCAHKRGGEFHLTAIDTLTDEPLPPVDDMARLRDALAALEHADPALAELVDLKYFCGFSFADVAAMRDVCERTVQRDWQKARLYLHDVLTPD